MSHPAPLPAPLAPLDPPQLGRGFDPELVVQAPPAAPVGLQRIRLASQIGSGLTGVLYVLDEPSIGLHQRDNERLLKTLKRLRDLGNTVIVVEHDEDAIRQADYLVDMGPAAGVHGGHVVAQGLPDAVMASTDSITAQYLTGRRRIDVPGALWSSTDWSGWTSAQLRTPRLARFGRSDRSALRTDVEREPNHRKTMRRCSS